MSLREEIIVEIIYKESKSGTMKEIGDKLRRCPDGVCVVNGNIDKTVQKVLNEKNFVAILVLIWLLIYTYIHL